MIPSSGEAPWALTPFARISNPSAVSVQVIRSHPAADEYFSYQTWLDAFAACGVDPDFYTTRGFGLNELLPWDTISDGVSTGCLLRERERAYRSETTPDCRTACNGCGANCLLKGGRCDA